MTLVIYKDMSGDFRWRLMARDGRILGDCGEGKHNGTEWVRNIYDAAARRITPLKASNASRKPGCTKFKGSKAERRPHEQG